MKKLCKDGSYDLKHVTILGKFLFVYFITISISLSQVKINGFGRLNNYPTFQHYTNIYQTDFNRDSFPDVILFNSENNNVVTHASTSNSSFNEPKNKFFFFPITDIANFKNEAKKEPIQIFVSRKERLAGLVSFTKNGTLKLLNIIRFTSYPSKVISADLNNDGKNEALVFGKTFAGLSLLFEDNSFLHDTSITQHGSYSDADFINLDYDNYTDIVAINMLNNSINFFYNNGNNIFQNERQIEFRNPISNLQTVDFNNDSYSDLIFTSGNSFNVLLGDSVSSFIKSRTITVNDGISKFIVGDFNSDKLNDLVYINGNKDNIHILFGLTDSIFTKPILLYKNNNLTELQFYESKKNSGLFCLSADGNLCEISNNSALLDSFGLAFTGKPGKLLVNKPLTKNNYQLSFIDNYDLSFKTFLGTGTTFSSINKTPISELFSNIVISNNGKNTVFFKKNNRLIELLQTKNDSSKLKQIYTAYPIMDVNFISSEGQNFPVIAAVTSNNDSTGVSFLDSNDIQFTKSNFLNLGSGIIDAKIYRSNNLEVFYWKSYTDTLIYIRKNLQLGNSNVIYKEKIQTDSVGNISTKVKLYNNESSQAAKPISIIQQKDKFKILIVEKGKMQIVNLAKERLGNKINSIENVKYFYDNKLKQKSFFILTNNSTAIFKLDVDKNFKLQSLSKYIESEKVYDYLVTKLFGIFNYVVYTSKADNYIKFLRIK